MSAPWVISRFWPLLCCLLWPAVSFATLAFDAASNSTAGTGTLSWTHTPVGTPSAVVVYVFQNVGQTDEVTGVTYGGDAMADVSGSPLIGAVSEPGVTHAFFLGTSIPTGAQSVVVSVNGTASNKIAGAVTWTAASDTSVEGTTTIAVTNPGIGPTGSITTGAVETAAVLGNLSGANTTSGINPVAGWTSRFEHDYTDQIGLIYTLDTNDPGSNVPWGLDTTTNIFSIIQIAIAIKEDAGGAPAGRAVIVE